MHVRAQHPVAPGLAPAILIPQERNLLYTAQHLHCVFPCYSQSTLSGSTRGNPYPLFLSSPDVVWLTLLSHSPLPLLLAHLRSPHEALSSCSSLPMMLCNQGYKEKKASLKTFDC
eukprot:1158604-Pelagomonas_calceolata.AAC.7